MLYFERRHKDWVVNGYTIADSQFGFINKHLKTMLKGDWRVVELIKLTNPAESTMTRTYMIKYRKQGRCTT